MLRHNQTGHVMGIRLRPFDLRSLTLTNLLVMALVCLAPCIALAQEPEDEEGARQGRIAYERMSLSDPTTQSIPENVRARELQFAARVSAAAPRSGTKLQGVDFVSRGPGDMGARTRAIGIDVDDENIILAGGTTGGMWRSSDRGASWARTTPLSALPSTSCLAQDTRDGRTDTWYYGTGEFFGNTGGYPLGLNPGARKWGAYFGNGIFKSTDDGLTWDLLPSTRSDTIGSLVQPFNFLFRIAIDRSNDSEDVVYAAVPGGIERSSDGGATWKMVLESTPATRLPDGAAWSDVAVTSTGVVYAVITSDLHWKRVRGDTALPAESSEGGIYRSTNGIDWVKISPPGWRRTFFTSKIAVAPSNENVLYFAFDSLVNARSYYDLSTGSLWKYTYRSGDGSGSGGTFEDRPVNSTSAWLLAVKPDDEEVVFVGGVVLYRSTDGFATPGRAISTPHVDHWAITFFPSNPSAMILGCDGGIFLTSDNLKNPIQWKSLNNGYVTTQFYTVAIDHGTPGDPTIIGGLQDNGTNFTNSADARTPWTPLYPNDGTTCAIADGRTSYYISWQYGHAYRKLLDDLGGERDYTRIDPIGSTQLVWINPFCLDRNNMNRMYFGGGSFLWRNDDLTQIPLRGDTATTIGWTKLARTTLRAIDPVIYTPMITAITSAKIPSGRVYYGTNDGRLFRLDSADAADPVPMAIWESKGFPKLGYVISIATDLSNADNAIVAFGNYNVQSLFHTSDGGATWTPIGGNLEEHPDGTGSGPSFRTVAIMHSGRSVVYLVGTSTGLYSTSRLDGISTIWTLEAEATIGNGIVNMIDTRESDGMVVVATCGDGMFSGRFAPASSVNEESPKPFGTQANPNPLSSTTEIMFDVADDGIVTLTIYDMLGSEIATLVSGRKARGHYTAKWDATDVPRGPYYYRLTSGSESFLRALIVTR
jgi:photosystem II stability/assembly factor-like uncharacterized protein